MHNLLNPRWIFILNTLPIIVLFGLFFGEYKIINSLLEEKNIMLWMVFGCSLAILGVSNLAYGIYLTSKKKSVSQVYASVALFVHIIFIYFYGFHSEDIVPFSIPRWMVSGDMYLYVGTFLMPTLTYCFFIIVAYLTPESKDHNAWKSFAIAVAIPISCYIFSQIILPLWQPAGIFNNTHVILIVVIVTALLFLFFLVRSIFILVTHKNKSLQKFQLLWKIPITLILPLLGLAVNNGQLFGEFYIGDSGVFGDFNSYWFYVIAIVNGLVICLPNYDKKIYRLLLFIGRSITFAYTFYFFVVFLPFLPLSVVAIAAIGTGFLMLTPLLLFVIHVNQLSKDFHYLKSKFSRQMIWACSIIGILVMPIALTLNYISDQNTLNKTLQYLYSPDYSKSYDIDDSSLRNTLNIVKRHKNNRSGGIFGSQQPYLSSYFNWIVLDNLTLSDSKINAIERIFFGEDAVVSSNINIRNESVAITDISTSSVYDESQNAWKSWVNLEITNNNENNGFSEYATTINLSEGTWISDYYLYVGDDKEMGILSEKKTAMWIFANIRNENKDPGILYYLTGNKVSFRVFPFAKNEVRKTGIEFLHREPIQLTIDGNTINLGETEISLDTNYENERVVYISPSEKEGLKKVTRTPYFHFLVDATNKDDILKYQNSIEELQTRYPQLSKNARVSFVNSKVAAMDLDEDWEQAIQNIQFGGGYYVERAIKSEFYNSYLDQSNSYPIIVVVTDDMQNAVISNDFADWNFSFPESHLFYALDGNGIMKTHSLIKNPKRFTSDTTCFYLDHPVLELKLKDNSIHYIPDNKQPSIVLKVDSVDNDNFDIQEKKWESGLNMQAQWMTQILHPEKVEGDWLNLVKNSFISRIMSPVTSYLVVENDAQKAILKAKQEQVLSSNKLLDIGDETQSMSEPNLWILMLSLGLIFLYRKRRRNVVQ